MMHECNDNMEYATLINVHTSDIIQTTCLSQTCVTWNYIKSCVLFMTVNMWHDAV